MHNALVRFLESLGQMTENDEVYKFTHSEPDGRSSLLYKGARDGD